MYILQMMKPVRAIISAYISGYWKGKQTWRMQKNAKARETKIRSTKSNQTVQILFFKMINRRLLLIITEKKGKGYNILLS